jgi:chromate transporter
LITLQGFGGVITVMQRTLVDQRKWFSQAEFLEMFTLSQVLPGPNVCNLALMIGDRFFGAKGAVVAMMGMLVLPLGVILVLASSYDQVAVGSPLAGMIKGMSVVAVGMTLGTGLRLLSGIQTDVVGRLVPMFVIAVVLYAVGYLRLSVAWAVFGCGAVSYLWARHCLQSRLAKRKAHQ